MQARLPVSGRMANGPCGQEVLHGAAIVRSIMAHRRDDAGLRVAPADDLDAGGLAQGRLAPVGGDDQRGFDLATVGQRDAGAASRPQ